MIISPQKLLIVHPHRTGGTSLISSLIKTLNISERQLIADNKDTMIDVWAQEQSRNRNCPHSEAKENVVLNFRHMKPKPIIEAILGGGIPCTTILKQNKMFDNYLKVALVRNPWDRALALFLNFGRPLVSIDKRRVNTETLMEAFEEFLDVLPSRDNRYIKPISYYVDAEIDFVIRHESLQEDYDKLCEKIGIKQNPLLDVNSHKSHGPKVYDKKMYYLYYSDKAKELVAEIFQEDIEKFDYEF